MTASPGIMGVVEDLNSYFAAGGSLADSAKAVGTLGEPPSPFRPPRGAVLE